MASKKPLILDLTTGQMLQMQTGDFLDVTQGGTGATTASGALTALGAYPASNPNSFINAAGAPVQSVAGKTGAVVLTQADISGMTSSSSPTFAAVTATTFTGALVGNASTATSLAGGTINSFPYQSAAGVTSFLAAGTAGQILQTNGTAAPPQWVNGNTLTLQSSQITSALGFIPVDNAKLGAVNGVATLDSSGKLTTAQIPAALVGAVQYQGTWNASTNTPTLASGTGTKGYYYKVSVAGTTNIDGQANWAVGDMIIFNGTTWDAIDGATSEVSSVAGRIGAIVLAQADISGLTTTSSPTFAAVTATTFTGALSGNATSATNLAGGVMGSVPYQSGAGTTTFLAPGTSGYILQTKGAGLAPVWVDSASLSAVSSVAGRTGAVVLSQADISGLTTSSSPKFAAVTAATFTGNLVGNASTSSANISVLTNDAAATLAIGSVVYNDASGGVQLAKADADATSNPVGLLAAAVAAGGQATVVTGKEITATAAQWQAVGAGASGLTPGAQYFLSNASAGFITTVVPTTGYVIRIGTALSATKMLVRIGPRIQL